MFKNLQKICQLTSTCVNKSLLGGAASLNAAQFSTNASRVLMAKVNKEETELDDDFNLQKTSAGKVRFLEKLGIVKPHISWPQYNRIIYPPSEDGKPVKNPFVHHMRPMIKYPAKKLWYPAFLIRGMSIDEAIKQLSFHKMKGAAIIKEVLLEAQELAVKQHNIEYKSNLWISYSSTTKSVKIKGVRKHRAYRFGVVEYKYCNYYVRLEEGQPPADYHLQAETYEARAKEYIERLRNRSIHLSI